MSVKMTLGLGFGTILVILAVLGITTHTGLGNIQAQAYVVANNAEKKELTVAIDAAMEKQLAGARGFLLTKNEAPLERYREGNQRLGDSADKLEKLLVTDEGKKALADPRPRAPASCAAGACHPVTPSRSRKRCERGALYGAERPTEMGVLRRVVALNEIPKQILSALGYRIPR